MIEPPESHISEKDFQATVVALARAHGWMVYGTLDQREYAKRLSKGFPDLVLIKPRPLGQAPIIHFWELKSQNGRISPSQREWLDALGPWARVFRPSDLDEIEEILR